MARWSAESFFKDDDDEEEKRRKRRIVWWYTSGRVTPYLNEEFRIKKASIHKLPLQAFKRFIQYLSDSDALCLGLTCQYLYRDVANPEKFSRLRMNDLGEPQPLYQRLEKCMGEKYIFRFDKNDSRDRDGRFLLKSELGNNTGFTATWRDRKVGFLYVDKKGEGTWATSLDDGTAWYVKIPIDRIEAS